MNSLYYFFKPFIPRSLQIALRKKIVSKKRALSGHIWPIDPESAKEPPNWPGWPEGKRFALVLTHDVESARGVERCVHIAEMEKTLGLRSAFNFVAEDYPVNEDLYSYLREAGYEIGVHGLNHSGNLFRSKEYFLKRAGLINHYMKKWGADGFRAPSMYHNLDWLSQLDVDYDMSTFDTDPFEPQPDGMGTIFPFWVQNGSGTKRFVEIPYTLPQDFTLFVLMGEKSIEIWKRKLDWIVAKGGMALVIVHPDYLNCNGTRCTQEEYPAEFYKEFLDYVKNTYGGQYWNPLPREMASFWKDNMAQEGR